jgi:hypothetical protein
MHEIAVADRFMRKVDIVPGTCWEWRAAKSNRGYGFFSLSGKQQLAHRISYEINSGPIPEGLTLDHLCGNPGCVNHRHLEAVSMRVNVRRGNNLAARNARKTHCPQGHSYDYFYKNARHCTQCINAGRRKRYQAKRQSQGAL